MNTNAPIQTPHALAIFTDAELSLFGQTSRFTAPQNPALPIRITPVTPSQQKSPTLLHTPYPSQNNAPSKHRASQPYHSTISRFFRPVFRAVHTPSYPTTTNVPHKTRATCLFPRHSPNITLINKPQYRPVRTANAPPYPKQRYRTHFSGSRAERYAYRLSHNLTKTTKQNPAVFRPAQGSRSKVSSSSRRAEYKRLVRQLKARKAQDLQNNTSAL